MDRERSKVGTRVKVGVTKKEIRKALAMGGFSAQEERFLRLRYGLGEPREAPLGRHRPPFVETRAAIAMYEKAALEHLRSRKSRPNPIRDKIIRKLKESP